MKCARCSHAMAITERASHRRYMICSHKSVTRGAGCSGTGYTILESYVYDQIKSKLTAFEALDNPTATPESPRVIQNKIQLAQIDEQIEALVAKVPEVNHVLMAAINAKVEELDAERQALSLEIVSANSMRSSGAFASILDHVAAWEDASIGEKERVVDALIDRITIADGKMDIFWNI